MRMHAEPKPLDGPLEGGPEGTTVTVEPILCGQLHSPMALLERRGGKLEKTRLGLSAITRAGWELVPVQAYLIRHPVAGPVLVDTGLHSSVAAKPSENLGRMTASIARPVLAPGQDLATQLRERGVDARDLPTVVMTHLHFDHASGIAEYPNSTFIVAAREWEHVVSDTRPALHGYRPQHYDYVFDYRLVDYDGPGIRSYSTFARTFDLFGDGSVRLAFTPGHTPGHQALICHLKDRDFVIAGDAVYTMNQLAGGAEPLEPADRHTWRRSIQEIQLFHRTYPQAVISPGHDPAHFASLEAKYE